MSSARLLYISGDVSGVGKSTVSLSVLSLALQIYQSSDIAYIKPCTQCEEIGLIAKYCHLKNIDCVPIGPIVFYQGFTQKCIDEQIDELANEQSINQSNQAINQSANQSINQSINQSSQSVTQSSPSIAKRHASIKQSINQISHNKKLVIVDGVGYPSVGSVCGVSNAQVARLIDSPVILVSRAGVGNAIDATNYMRDFFQANQCNVIGVVFNKLPVEINQSISQSINQSTGEVVPQSAARHTAQSIKEYTKKYFTYIAKPALSVYGHLPKIEIINQSINQSTNQSINQIIPATERVCMVKPNSNDLEMTDDEKVRLEAFIEAAKLNLDFEAIMKDVEKHYATQGQ